MKLLLTSNGLSNESIRRAFADMLGKPIVDASALFVATGMYPYAGGPGYAWRAIAGKAHHPVADLGWKSFGNLELSVLSSIDKDVWQPTVAAADAIFVYGGDPIFLAYWMREAGLVISPNTVYVGTSAGSMAASTFIGEMFDEPRRAKGDVLSTESVVMPEGPITCTYVSARGLGLVDVSIIPHYCERKPADAASATNAPVWAAKIPQPTYAIDDATAIQVIDGKVEVISEGRWKLFSGGTTG
ncbi:MAG: Type 1 glutamine amidotransferase-like domain-containing protein [Kofleriaceae bacterium]